MAEVIPPNTRAVGTADPPGDMNNVADMLTLICEVLAQAGEVTTTTPATAVTAVQALRTVSIGPGLLPRPRLYAPTHLRRWRAALALADQQVVPVVVAGDSIMWGTGSDNTTSTTNATAIVKGACARLRSYFASHTRTLLTNPGEGFIFPNDSRVTVAGGAVQNAWACTPFGQGYRLIGATQTLTFTVPAGVTSVGVIQGNMDQAFNAAGSNLADVAGLYNINGGGNIALTALTGTDLPIVTSIAVTAGQTFQVIGPATAQTYIPGFILNSASTTGVQVHRVCLNGAVSGRLLGGQTSGTLDKTAGLQVYSERSTYRFCPTPGVIIVEFCVNDQQFQNGGGTTSQNGVTQAKYTAWLTQYAAQAVADGWCVLMLGTVRDQGFAPGFPQVDDYLLALKTLALATDHVAFLDAGEVWGPYAASQADGVQVASSVHPNTAGAGDLAALLCDTLTATIGSGITELTAG
jgi:lysophospholipase L1-like esterase